MKTCHINRKDPPLQGNSCCIHCFWLLHFTSFLLQQLTFCTMNLTGLTSKSSNIKACLLGTWGMTHGFGWLVLPRATPTGRQNHSGKTPVPVAALTSFYWRDLHCGDHFHFICVKGETSDSLKMMQKNQTNPLFFIHVFFFLVNVWHLQTWPTTQLVWSEIWVCYASRD